MLTSIKILHTFIWAVLATCVLALPVAGLTRRFRCAGILLAVVSMECLVLLLNHLTCPLTNVAKHYTQNRSDNFDIYLPLWLARCNKEVFGSLFVVGILVFVSSWVRARDQR